MSLRDKVVKKIKDKVEYVKKDYEPKPFKPSEFNFNDFTTSEVTIEHMVHLDPSLHPDKRFKPPSRADIKNSVCLYVSFDLVFNSEGMPHIVDIQTFRNHAANDAFVPWSGVPGLRNKIFWLNEEK
jgi:hypothetical protein